MPNKRPLVTAALICENVILENDGVPTIVRVIDRATFSVPPNLPPGIQGAVHIQAFFAVKAGDLSGDHEFSLVARTPDGKTLPASEKWNLHLEGGESGGNLKLSVGFPGKPGLYWLDLTWNGEVLTSTPFRLAQADPVETPEK
jgi:hypothetical protein